MMSRLKSVVQNLKSDVSRVLIASGINKLISLLLSIVIVRILSKEEYGLFSFAFNKVSIIMVFSGFGITSGILQFCSESISLEKKKQYYKFGLVFGVIANLICCLWLRSVMNSEIQCCVLKTIWWNLRIRQISTL